MRSEWTPVVANTNKIFSFYDDQAVVPAVQNGDPNFCVSVCT